MNNTAGAFGVTTTLSDIRNEVQDEAMEESLRKNILNLQYNIYDCKIKLVVRPLDRAIEKMKRHKPIIELSASSKHRKDWLKAADVIYTFLRGGNDSTDYNIFELMKAHQLMDCMEVHADVDFKHIQHGIKFHFPEQDPLPWIRLAEERVNRYVQLIQDLNKSADD